MTSVVEKHARFTVDSARSLSTTQQALYDDYDIENDKAAKQYLLNVLEPELSTEIEEKLDDGDSFATDLDGLCGHYSAEHCVTLPDHASEDGYTSPVTVSWPRHFEAMARDLCSDYKELDAAGQYDHNDTLTVLEQLLEADDGNNQEL